MGKFLNISVEEKGPHANLINSEKACVAALQTQET